MLKISKPLNAKMYPGIDMYRIDTHCHMSIVEGTKLEAVCAVAVIFD
jgi:hypothetical protein